MSNPRKTINSPIADLTEDEIFNEMVFIIEVGLVNTKIVASEVRFFKKRLHSLIEAMPDGDRKSRFLNKLRDKKRFSAIINDTGNKDMTGYGEHLY